MGRAPAGVSEGMQTNGSKTDKLHQARQDSFGIHVVMYINEVETKGESCRMIARTIDRWTKAVRTPVC